MSWDEFFCSMLVEVSLPCYRSSCHSAFHLTIVFKIYGPQTSSAGETDDRSTPVQGCKQYVTWFLNFGIVSHVNFYFLTTPL